MPPDVRSGPQDRQPGSRSYELVTAIAPESDVIVTDTPDNGQPKRRGRRRPLAFASQAAPCAGRGWWHVMYQCGACGGTHFGRSPEELITGVRTARCGRRVWLVIARTYRGQQERDAA